MDIEQKKLREEFIAAQKALGEVEKLRDELIKPIKTELNKARERFELAQEDLPLHVGCCEVCGEPLFEGDKGQLDVDSGIYLCEEHSPTYGDLVAQMNETPKKDWDDVFGHGDDGDGQEAYDFLSSNNADDKYIITL